MCFNLLQCSSVELLSIEQGGWLSSSALGSIGGWARFTWFFCFRRGWGRQGISIQLMPFTSAFAGSGKLFTRKSMTWRLSTRSKPLSFPFFLQYISNHYLLSSFYSKFYILHDVVYSQANMCAVAPVWAGTLLPCVAHGGSKVRGS